MQVEVWSDFVCPFCYIGKRRLENALSSFPYRDQVEVIFRSFELDPNAKEADGESMAELLSAKYNVSLEQAKGMCENMRQQAAGEDLTYDFDKMIPTNSFDAHRLVHYATENEKMNEMSERLFYAFFTESKNIGDHETLASLGEELGFDGEDIKRMLSSEEYTKEVRNDESMGSQLGIQGVPFFVFDGKYAVSGAQPSEMFEKALVKAWGDGQTLEVVGEDTNSCTTDSCDM
ncbi:DsbA family oxidoreductase [Guptibacillus hwajinpoensis]|uniref:DsbA family dithiol-disulfide isomerase n=1 Tax=Guptibacillus hwajinpoensis TaxID=208199 RepID=A0ABU0K8A8_9BACL|nr:DsbA family oxidoreductase [Alkalihalobacillus hemicentroti]MDQ0484736.1 putative DsbA family dithiol-disulfide isomerase [Alkalihalobacillus hemicentroti]